MPQNFVYIVLVSLQLHISLTLVSQYRIWFDANYRKCRKFWRLNIVNDGFMAVEHSISTHSLTMIGQAMPFVVKMCTKLKNWLPTKLVCGVQKRLFEKACVSYAWRVCLDHIMENNIKRKHVSKYMDFWVPTAEHRAHTHAHTETMTIPLKYERLVGARAHHISIFHFICLFKENKNVSFSFWICSFSFPLCLHEFYVLRSGMSCVLCTRVCCCDWTWQMFEIRYIILWEYDSWTILSSHECENMTS